MFPSILLLRFDDIPSLLSHDASGREFLRAHQTATVAQTNEGSYYILVMNTGRSDGSQTDSQVKDPSLGVDKKLVAKLKFVTWIRITLRLLKINFLFYVFYMVSWEIIPVHSFSEGCIRNPPRRDVIHPDQRGGWGRDV